MNFWDSVIWSLIGLFVEPNERLSIFSSKNEKELLGRCKTFQDYLVAGDKLRYYQDYSFGEKVLYGFIKTARGGKNFELALKHTIFDRVDYVSLALARKARTFEEIYVLLWHWNTKCHPAYYNKVGLLESLTIKILYKKINRMTTTSERRKRMNQLSSLNETFGHSYDYSLSFFIQTILTNYFTGVKYR